MELNLSYIKQLIFKQIDNIYRFTQDSPVYPEVWLEYYRRAVLKQDERVDLIFTPHRDSTAAELMKSLREMLLDMESNRQIKTNPWALATTGEAVAANLIFDELILAAIPLTAWWANLKDNENMGSDNNEKQTDGKQPANSIEWKEDKEHEKDLEWFKDLAGAILWIKDRKRISQTIFNKAQSSGDFKKSFDSQYPELTTNMKSDIWTISINRRASINMFQSVPSTKADSCRRLFNIDGSKICWAVLDTGIDAEHPAFRKIIPGTDKTYDEPFEFRNGDIINNTRVKASYDFNEFRKHISDIETVNIVKFQSEIAGLDIEFVPEILKRKSNKNVSQVELNDHVRAIEKALRSGRMLDWAAIEPLLKISPEDDENLRPKHPHGTHVAGIIGADDHRRNSRLLGMCPGIELYDIRVLNDQGYGEEFNILAAIQFVRWLNRQSDQIQIHGINLSLSLPHVVANYACGRTPICESCIRLVSEGSIVVAAAGNKGQTMYKSEDGFEEQGFRTINITDPGNAEHVITVGATHKSKPHTYGVSYFSSRGPTGDGRYKPDLVAPGEKILSTVLNGNAQRMDGTSMAAPHASGAAALVLSKHRELIGQPGKVKQILCESATDLGRERYFQGHGMLDVLRAIQSV